MKKNIILLFALGCLFWADQSRGQSYLPEYRDARMKIKPAVPIKAYAFDLKDVLLLPGNFQQAMQADEAYLLSINPDRLLSDFRIHSGLKAKGAKYEGWESSGLAGHTLGHYLSAMSMLYASTQKPELLKRVNYMVDELEICQKAHKTGYVGAIPKEDTIWAEVAKGDIRSRGFDLNGGWSPWYTVHKVMAGLLDAYLYTGNQKALKICTGMADWTGETLKNLNDAQIQQMLVCEYGGMAEVLANLYAITGEKKYLDISYKFYDKKVLDPLARQQDILPGKHSNTQIPKIIASARRFELDGDKNDQAIADFFWQTVVQNHSYATGGNSNYEYLSEPNKLSDKLTENTTETCNTYNMLKLTRHLFAVQPSAMLMDYYEKGLYNHILASQNHSDGMMCYFVPLRMGGKKEYSTPFTTFTCCVGSGMENHVKYNESIYFRGADGSVYVNLFIPSVLNFKEKGIRITQHSNLPENNKITFSVNAKTPVLMPIKIRKPKWSSSEKVSVNGVAQPETINDEGYMVLSRKWKTGDVISLTLSENIYTEAMPDNASRKAVFYGPVLLAGVLGDKEPDPVMGVPVLVISETDPNKWLQMVDPKQLSFNTKNVGRPNEVKLMPFNQTKNEYYTIYWDVFTPEKWADQQKTYDAEKKKQQEMELRTVDILRPGEMQPERDHQFAGEKATLGEDHTKKWRATEENGFLSYEMKIDPKEQNTLINTYWGTDNRGRKFDILVDGVSIGAEDLNQYKESRFYDIAYKLPIERTRGKSKVVIKLIPEKGNSVGPLYGSKVVKD